MGSKIFTRRHRQTSLEKLIALDQGEKATQNKGLRDLIRDRIQELQDEIGCSREEIIQALTATPRRKSRG